MEQFNRFLPEKPLIENDDFIIYGNNDLELVKEDIINFLSRKKTSLLDFFGLKSFKKLAINLFNSQEIYIKFTRQFSEPASYSRGNLTNNEMINYTYDINAIARLKSCLIHELVHLFYQSIWKGKYDRILWLDEGLAIFLSGEKSGLENNDKRFKKWYLYNIIRYDKEIPKIEFLKEHGNTYGKFVDQKTNKYNGYDLSYLMVRYMIEHYNDIIPLLKDGQRIKDLEDHILKDCINYYNIYFQVDKIKQSFYDIETDNELMDYMDKNIAYGWLDMQNNPHIDTLTGFRENYKTSSIEEILSSKIGTCIEQAKLIKNFFDRIGLENKLYCHRRYETGKLFDKEVRMHCFVLFHYQDKWYHFEHSNYDRRGIHKYDSIESAIENEINRCSERDMLILTEIPDIPAGLTFKQFNEYVNTFEPVSTYETPKKL